MKGTLTQIDVPGSAITAADRINNQDAIVGLFGSSSSGPFSGYLLAAGKYTTIMFPGSTETRTRGLNSNTAVGRYTDSAGVIHGYKVTK